jgi:hypothetical protein
MIFISGSRLNKKGLNSENWKYNCYSYAWDMSEGESVCWLNPGDGLYEGW